jgi:beta-N-acetylhexosaminidase
MPRLQKNMLKFLRSFFSLRGVVLFSFLFSLLAPLEPAQAQENLPNEEILALIENMTAEERVGQLFLLSFDGVEVAEDSDLADFLAAYPVGGVILRADNGNFAAAPETVSALFRLTASLQEEAWNAAQSSATKRAYVPLLIGISQEDGGALAGLSPQPSPMAIGATWDSSLAAQNGDVLGRELAALGINLYLGPSLDVLSDPNHDKSGDLGTWSFGGNPSWVGEMGKAFISGLHSGSEGKLLVVAKHFPGRGSADRSPEVEIATVRKTLDELKKTELHPFFSTTGTFPAAENADGLLVSHIRYQGFQGNIRPMTRPVSLDEKSLSEILSLSPIDEWRLEGGLTLSDDLGSQAIRDFYAPGGEDFYAHLVARDAFLAGNDLLYMGNIRSSDSADSFASIAKSLDFFAQKYDEDAAFAARVDEALVRILTQKKNLYPSFSLSAVRPSETALEGIGKNQATSFSVAQNAATLISPSIKDLDTVLPFPPELEERLIFITDTQPSFSASALPDAILRLYGEQGGEQISEAHLSYYSFDDFLATLESEEDTFFESSLRQADWVILSLGGFENLPVLRQLLAENQTLLREKKIILFSFTAPYALDATDISKLTAYYGLYSYEPPFLEVAARLLFKELTPVGAAPVSIGGIGYELETVTQAAPNQLLTLNLALPLEASPTLAADSATPAPTAIPMFQVGDTLSVRTGAILDHNGNLVPDGTKVVFSLRTGGESGVQQLIETQTSGGIARADFQLDQTGLLDIRVASGEATISETLRLDISDEGVAAAVTIIPPASPEAVTPTPASTPTLMVSSPYFDEGKPKFSVWFIAFLLWILGAISAYFAGKSAESPLWGVRWGLMTLLGGLIAYNYLALNLLGASAVIESGLSGVIVFILGGEILGWLIGWFWLRNSA